MTTGDDKKICPKCGKEMKVSHRNKNQILWKCRKCGHMTLVQDLQRQNWDRNDTGKEH